MAGTLFAEPPTASMEVRASFFSSIIFSHFTFIKCRRHFNISCLRSTSSQRVGRRTDNLLPRLC